MVKLCVLTCVVLLTCGLAVPSGQAAPPPTEVFVDLDGDGLDDYLIDFQDGFFIEDHLTAVETPVAGIGGEVFDAFAGMTPAEYELSAKDDFVQRSFSARSISACRGDFDADFGSGESAGGGGGAKTCVGGVCY